jgi:hypothetical protein
MYTTLDTDSLIELDFRSTNGIEVRLLWKRDTNTLSLSGCSTRS